MFAICSDRGEREMRPEEPRSFRIKNSFRSGVTGGSFRLSIRGPEVLHCFRETKTGT